MAYGVEATQHLTRLINDTFPSMNCTICYGSKAFPQIASKTVDHAQPIESEVDSVEHRNNTSFFQSLSLAQMVSPMWRSLNAPMIDFIFIVDDPEEWHRQNMSTQNYYHYSMWLRLFGAPFVSYVQSLGPGVLYNPFIALRDDQMMMKYGVITTSQLVDDLVYWRSLYVAGRLQKPVLLLNDHDTVSHTVTGRESTDSDSLDVGAVISDFYALTRSDEEQDDHQNDEAILLGSTATHFLDPEHLDEAMLLNLDFAARVALMMLSARDRDHFTLRELFMTIASLSYCGDNRHQFYAEDNRKFEKIVNGSYDAFIALYSDIVQQYIEPVAGSTDPEKVYALRNGIDVEYLAQRLPGNLVSEMVEVDADIMAHLDDVERVEKCIYAALSSIVGSSSWVQTVKGVFSAGFVNSFWYLLRKMTKYLQSMESKKAVVAEHAV